MFWGQIWPQKLKFSKLTEICYRGTSLYAYYDFNVYFFKFFLFIFFGQIWSQNLKFSKVTEIRCRGALLNAYYYFKVYFFKNFYIHIILGTFRPKICSCPNWLESGICVHYQYYMLIKIEGSNFLKFSCSKYYGKTSFHLGFSKLTELHGISKLNFSKCGEQHILGWNLPQKFMKDKYFEQLHMKTVISI